MSFDLEKEQLKLHLVETQISLLQYQRRDIQSGISAHEAAEATEAAELAKQRERNR